MRSRNGLLMLDTSCGYATYRFKPLNREPANPGLSIPTDQSIKSRPPRLFPTLQPTFSSNPATLHSPRRRRHKNRIDKRILRLPIRRRKSNTQNLTRRLRVELVLPRNPSRRRRH